MKIQDFTIEQLERLEPVRCIPCGGEGGYTRGTTLHLCEQCEGEGIVYRMRRT